MYYSRHQCERLADASDSVAVAGSHLTLRTTADGCSLIGPEGEVVFRADGLDGRRACLEFARRHGVLALSS